MQNLSTTDPAPERSLADWVRLVRDGWPALVLCIGLGVAGALFYSSRQKVAYGATSTAVVSPKRGFLDPQNADQLPALADTVARLLPTPLVIDDARSYYIRSASDVTIAQQRSQVATFSWMKAHVSAVREADTAIVQLVASAGTQLDATDLSRAAGTALTHVVNTLAASRKGVPGGLTLTSLPATNNGQTSPTRTRNVVIGANAGILIGILLAFLLGTARRRIWRPEDLGSELGVPVLGVMHRHRRSRLSTGRGFAAVPQVILERSTGPLTRLLVISGTKTDKYIPAAAHRIAESLVAYGAHTVLLNHELEVVEARVEPAAAGSLNGEAAGAETAADVSARETVSTGIGPRGFRPSGLSEGATPSSFRGSSQPRTAADYGDDRPGIGSHVPSSRHDFLIAAARSASDSEQTAEHARYADHVIVVAERGVSARALRRIERLGVELERRLLGAILLD